MKICWESPNLVKIGPNIGHLMWIPKYVLLFPAINILLKSIFVQHSVFLFCRQRWTPQYTRNAFWVSTATVVTRTRPDAALQEHCHSRFFPSSRFLFSRIQMQGRNFTPLCAKRRNWQRQCAIIGAVFLFLMTVAKDKTGNWILSQVYNDVTHSWRFPPLSWRQIRANESHLERP